MDLQSILDASDSLYGDDESSADDNIDIERLLQQSEDEDDDIYVGHRRAASSPDQKVTADDILGMKAWNDKPSWYRSDRSHSATEWAVLQSILLSDGEDEDDATEGSFSEKKVDLWNEALIDEYDSDSPIIRFRADPTEITQTSSPLRHGVASEPSASSVPSTTVSHKDKEKKARIIQEKDEENRVIESSQRAQLQAFNREQRLLKSGQREMVSPLKVKRRLKQKVELESRGTYKQARNSISSMGASRLGSSGIVDNKVLSKLSETIVAHSRDDAKVKCGLPTCLAFNNKFISIGTQGGMILVFDLFEVLRQRLGHTKEGTTQDLRGAGSIASIDLSHNGETVIAGHESGLVVLWDTIRGTILRSVNDLHLCAITNVRFVADTKVISVDCAGYVNKLSFAKNMIWSNYSMETECLLDGTSGQILALNVLPAFTTVKSQLQSPTLSALHEKLSLIALSSERSTLTVIVDPTISVLHRWARPSERVIRIRDDPESTESYLPCLSWGWGLFEGSESSVTPTIAIAWGCCLQLLCVSWNSESAIVPLTDNQKVKQQQPGLVLRKEIDAERPILAVEWLDHRSIMFLTDHNEFMLLDTISMTLMEKLELVGLRYVYAEFSLSRAASEDSAESYRSSTTFQNSIRYSDDRLMILCKSEVKCLSVVGARKRIATLEADGEWLEALALALDHYENTVLSLKQKNISRGKREGLRRPEVYRVMIDDEEWLAKLLLRYLVLAVENAPSSIASSSRNETSEHHLTKSHFQMLAGVCVEYCSVTKNIELLFGPIFHKFKVSGHTAVFFDVLEPYVLNDKILYISAEVLPLFVTYCKAQHRLATVERCLLHLECKMMDVDSILSLLRRNSMYTALFYVYNIGLNDFVTPLQILFERLFELVAVREKSKSPKETEEFLILGYKALLYLKTAITGLTFPHQTDMQSDQKIIIKRELMSHMLSQKYLAPDIVSYVNSVKECKLLDFPYVSVLLQLDPRALFHTFALGLEHSKWNQNQLDSDETQQGFELVLSHQKVVDVFVAIMKPAAPSYEKPPVASTEALSALFDFITSFILLGTVQVDRPLTLKLLERKCNVYATADAMGRRAAQKDVTDLLAVLPTDSYEPDDVLQVLESSSMHRAALILHQQVASSMSAASSLSAATVSQHFGHAVDCYVEDDDEQFRLEVFSYVKRTCIGASENVQRPFREVLIDKITSLCHLSADMTARLVGDLFSDQVDVVIQRLGENPSDQFNFLHSIDSGNLALSLDLTQEQSRTYVALMARLHPDMVYDFLSSNDSYDRDECLALSERYDIPDARVYLLEKQGSVKKAVDVGLTTLVNHLVDFKRIIRNSDPDLRSAHGDSNRPLKQHERLQSQIRKMLVVLLDICERNSEGRGSSIWFTVLDRLMKLKSSLRLGSEHRRHAQFLAKIISDLNRLAMQRMIASVPLPDLVQKFTSKDAGSDLGEVREGIERLLSTYALDLRVYKESSKAFREDLYRHRRFQHRLCVQGTRVTSTGEVFDSQGVRLQPFQYTESMENSFRQSLRRLRDRRQSQVQRGSGRLARLAADTQKESEDVVVFGDRGVGALGQAHHRGQWGSY